VAGTTVGMDAEATGMAHRGGCFFLSTKKKITRGKRRFFPILNPK